MQIWINGVAATALPLPDRGLDFGDGVFETMPIVGGRIPWIGYHLARLQDGLLRLGFPDRAHEPAYTHILTALGSCQGDGVMRLTVTRGAGPRGYAPPDTPQSSFILQTWGADSIGQPTLPPARVQRCSVGLSRQPLLAGIKHLNRLEQVLAARERQRLGLDEMLMTDGTGNAISVISGNLFLLRGSEFLTPGLADCGILGTRRRLLFEELAPALGLSCREATISETEVEAADELLYCNSLRGFQPIGHYGSRHWRSHATIHRLQALYRERLHACAD